MLSFLFDNFTLNTFTLCELHILLDSSHKFGLVDAR